MSEPHPFSAPTSGPDDCLDCGGTYHNPIHHVCVCGHARHEHWRESGNCMTSTPEVAFACDCAEYCRDST